MLMEVAIRVTGLKVKNMAKASFVGLLEVSMTVNMFEIKNIFGDGVCR